jgi:hypothetical protein
MAPNKKDKYEYQARIETWLYQTGWQHIKKRLWGKCIYPEVMTQQLLAGTRFFDVRLKEHKSQVVPHHTTAGQGAYGTLSVDRILQTAALWCSVHKTEVVIFRISHTAVTTQAHEIARNSGSGVLHTGTGNLCTKTLEDITRQGGGLVCIFDEESFGDVIDQANGIHSYTKYKKNPSNDFGISTCGCYQGTHKLHNVIRNGLKGQYEHNTKHNETMREHLWQVYWQKTYVNPASTTGIEDGTTKEAYYKGGKAHGGTHAATDHMIHLMKGHGYKADANHKDYVLEKEESTRRGLRRRKEVTKEAVMWSTLDARNFMLPNIISYDFVNEEVNGKIIALNDNAVQANG